MDDIEFEALVDARLPYDNEPEWKRLVDLGRSVSPNAHYVTLSEICRPRRSARVPRGSQKNMVAYWSAGFEHPLKDMMLECAQALLTKRYLSASRSLEIMDEVANHHGYWGALVMPLYACVDPDEVDDHYQAIRSRWFTL